MDAQLDLLNWKKPYRNGAGHKEHGGPSEAASEFVTPHLHRVYPLILALLRDADLTSDEIALRLGRDKLFIRPRCTELIVLGEIHKTGLRRRAPGQRIAANILSLGPKPSEQNRSEAIITGAG